MDFYMFLNKAKLNRYINTKVYVLNHPTNREMEVVSKNIDSLIEKLCHSKPGLDGSKICKHFDIQVIPKPGAMDEIIVTFKYDLKLLEERDYKALTILSKWIKGELI